MNDKIAFMFKFRAWRYDPYEYVLVYEKNEKEARKLACEKFPTNEGMMPKPESLILVTYGL